MKRVSFVIDEKIEKAIKELGHRGNMGQFFRMAIHYYLDNHKAIKNIENSLSALEKRSIQPAEHNPSNNEDKAVKRSRTIDNLINMGRKEVES